MRIFSWWQRRCAFVLRKKIRQKTRLLPRDLAPWATAYLRPHYL
ncbi:Hypothetical protein I595_445 [Croceitalea dokdonensis DOKDO 023]|uniref:Uncharacterized protein n=1 Tax=Croceitalea dokdonensis DOKDO 023 TaxID=1300341 RepID=A0A0P7ANM3_9FLAO|nr:Hypothetical protein I595_445 [Croceitalea dokdonensis DOKDO 023]